MTMYDVALVGLLTGLHAATWGAYKDSPFEGFKPTSFLRTVVLSLGTALTLALMTGLKHGNLLVYVGVTYALERLITEWWKSIVREDDQSAYAIPMRLAIHGRTIDRRFHRYAAGVAVAGGLAAACWVAQEVQAAVPPLPIWTGLLIAGAGGWLTAVGGAWKDAPIEGFSGWKFLRSPAVSTAWGFVLIGFTHDWVTLTVAAAGWSVISIETYKTFLTGGRPPGKFDTKPARFAVAEVREVCRAVHIGLYAVLAAVAVAPLVTTPGGRTGESLALAAVALAAAMAGGLVVAQPRTRGQRTSSNLMPALRSRASRFSPIA
jgi:hypothetical protein